MSPVATESGKSSRQTKGSKNGDGVVSLKPMSWNMKASETYRKIKRYVESVTGGSGLKAQVFSGGAWLGAGSVSEQSFRLLRNIILARLLAPSAFGMMAIVLSAATFLQSLAEIGVKESLIQNPRGSEPHYVNAAWWMALGRAVSIYAVLFTAAPWIARFYGNHELVQLLRVANLSIVLEGAISSRAYVAMKEMKFHRWATAWHGGAILGIVTTITLAFFVRSVWALVIGTCAESLGRCVMSYIVCPHLPGLKMNFAAARDLMKFSRGLFGLSALMFIFMRADIFVLGKLISATALGYYALGIAVAQTPGSFVLNFICQIFLPALSHVRDDPARTRRVILKVTEVVILLGMPAIVFSCFWGRPLLTLTYGPAYAVAAGPLILASCAALVNIVNGLITLAIYAAGVPQLHRRCVAAMAIGMIILVYPLSKWLGPIGAQLASVISITIGFLLQLDYVRHLVRIKLSDYGAILGRGALISASVVVIFIVTRPIVNMTHPFLTIGLGISSCLVAYALAGMMFMRKPGFARY
ncbi:MAG TPA: oligosaccharide flippase family protein [Candidatus Acidoferrales bacterium]|jgi:PST family polysaccharide transporter/lipopolysaccharide exporter|nr:oligosaccharide flippase family protein [Candidatus Acidoferrales bacterium]